MIEYLCKADTIIIFEGADYGDFIHDYHKLFSNFGFSCIHQEYFPYGAKDTWNDILSAKSYARKTAVYEKNKFLGVFKRND